MKLSNDIYDNQEDLLKRIKDRDFGLKKYRDTRDFAVVTGIRNQKYADNALRAMEQYPDNEHIRSLQTFKIYKKGMEALRNGQALFGVREPPVRVTKGCIHIGKVVHSNHDTNQSKNPDLYLQLSEINRSIGLWGSAGSGKTNTLMYMGLQCLRLGIPCVFFCFNGCSKNLM